MSITAVSILDFVGVFAAVVGLSVLLWTGRNKLQRDVRWLLFLLLMLMMFFQMSNLLEWSGVSRAFDPFEDFVEVLEPLVWSFLFYALLQGIARQDLQTSEEKRFRVEAKMLQAQKLESLGVLAGGIAHDFNNLLTAIVGNVSIALSDISSSGPLRGRLLRIEKASKKAAELTRELLAFSGKGTFVAQAINLNDLVEEIPHLLNMTTGKKASISFNLDQDLPLIEGDPSQMSQVVMNLMTNASESIGEKGGVISLSTGRTECNEQFLARTYVGLGLKSGRYVYFQVADTGCGMDQETLSKIFDPFFTTKVTGRGLGLAAVLGIVQSHQGTLSIKSEVGEGTTFTLYFPESEQQLKREEEKAVEQEQWGGKGTVLVVDDEEIVREICADMLERAGFQVLLAKDGEEGVQVYREEVEDIRLVILDITMPGQSCEETLAELCRIDKSVKVVLSSGFSAEDTASRFSEQGISGFLSKPYGEDELIEQLRIALDS